MWNWQKIKGVPLIRLFSVIVISSFIIWVINLLAGHGNPLFWGRRLACDSLFDDFTYLTGNVYDLLPYEYLYPFTKAGFSYPPNAYLFFAFIGNLFNAINPFDMSKTHILASSLYLTFSISSMFMLIFAFADKFKNFDKYLFCTAILSSGVMLVSYERTNVIFITTLLLSFFIFYHNSNNKILKEISLLSLAAAISFKITPAIFAMFLIYDKDFRALFRLIFYSVFLFIIPALFYPGGLEVISTFIYNLTMFSSYIVDTFQVSGIGKGTINNILLALNGGGSISSINTMTTYWISGLGLLGLITTFFYKEKWKKALLMVLLMIFIPAVSYTYTLVYFIPVMVLYFMEENHSKGDIFFTFYFAVLFLTGTTHMRGSYYDYFIPEIGLWAIFLHILVYGFTMMFRSLKSFEIKDFFIRKKKFFSIISKSKIQTEYVKKRAKINLLLILSSFLIFCTGVLMYELNYSLSDINIKNISSPVIMNENKIRLGSDFRISINTTFSAQNTKDSEVIFQTADNSNGIQLKLYPNKELVLEYPISEKNIEKYIFEEIKPNTIYNFMLEITNDSISPLLSEYKEKIRDWKPLNAKPFRQKIMKDAIHHIIIGGSSDTKFSGEISDFNFILKNGNNTNFLVVIILLGTFFPLFVIFYSRFFRKVFGKKF